LTVRDPEDETERQYPTQFVPGEDGTGTILFNDNDLNQANYDLGANSPWVHTAASDVGHEFGHAAAHYGKGGVPKACAGDPAKGSTGCIVRFENKIRKELGPASGGVRPVY
jgi:hypothetical protein